MVLMRLYEIFQNSQNGILKRVKFKVWKLYLNKLDIKKKFDSLEPN